MTAKLRQRTGDQPLPVAGGKEVSRPLQKFIRNYAHVGAWSEARAEQLVTDLEARIQLGVQRYGSRLQTNNGRDCRRDLYEELLDAAHYAQQLAIEQPSGAATRRLWGIVGLLFWSDEA